MNAVIVRTFKLTVVTLGVIAFLGAANPTGAVAACSSPTISGTLKVGATLKATAGGCSGYVIPPNQSLQWYRCTSSSASSCTKSVKAAQGSPSSYRVTSADAGRRLGVKQVSSGVLPDSEVDWRLTGVVPAPPPSPPPPGGGGGDDGGGGGGSGGGGSGGGSGGGGSGGGGSGGGGSGGGAPGGGSGDGPARVLLLSPFPSVVMGGRLTRKGARVTRLIVRGPRGATVRVRCAGRGCKVKRGRARIGKSRRVRLRRFERHLRAGSVLKVLIARRGFIGKYAAFKFRRRRPPVRVDACARARSLRKVRCPA